MNVLEAAVKITCDDSEAQAGMSSLSTSALTKATTMGNLISSALTSAFSKVVDIFKSLGSGVVSLGQQALGAYSKYEQLKGGVETLFKNASGQVIEYAHNAYKTAGMSANQYMETATTFASTLVRSLANKHKQVVQIDLEAEKAMLDNQLANEKAAMDAAYKEQQRLSSHRQTEFKRQQEDEYEEYKGNLDKELAALRESNEQRVADTQESQEKQVKKFEEATNAKLKLMEREYNESLRLVDEELYNRTKAIDSQIDSLNAQTNAERAAQKKREQEEKKASLVKAVENAKNATERAKAQKSLDEYLEKLEQERREEQRKSQIEQLKEQKEQLKEQASARKEQLKSQYDQEVEQYKESRKRQEEALKESNKRELEEIRRQNSAKYAEQQEENNKILKAYRRRQEDEMTSFREAQDDQLAAFKAAQDAQYEALQAAASNRLKQLQAEADAAGEFAEATAEDYEEAARLTNMAITDMADNANKYGTAIESLQNAYQGFSKQNYTMLDNLKLGYGGTRAEMERLLEDAEKIKAKNGETVDYSIESMADIIEAIHAVQVEYGASGYSVEQLGDKLKEQSLTEQELHRISQDIYASKTSQFKSEEEAYNHVVEAYKNGSLTVQDALILTGTTSYEASKTVEGSLNSLQGAWENWLVSLADDEWDVRETTNNLVEAAGIAMENIVPRVATIIETLAAVIQEKGPWALEQLKTAFLDSLPPEWRETLDGWVESVARFLEGLIPLAEWLEQNLPRALETFGDMLDKASGENVGAFIQILQGLGTVLDWISSVFVFVGTIIGTVAADIVSGFQGLQGHTTTIFYAIGQVIRFFADLFKSVFDIIAGIVNGIINGWQGLQRAGEYVFTGIELFIKKFGEAFSVLYDGIKRAVEGIGRVWDGLKTWAKNTVDGVVNFFRNLPNNILNALGDLGNLLWNAGQQIISGFWDGLLAQWQPVQDWFSGIGDWIVNNKGPEEYDKKLLVPAGTQIMQGFNKGLRSQMGIIKDTLSDVTDLFTSDLTMNASVSSASNTEDEQQSKRLGAPYILIQEMNVQDKSDIYDLAWQLNSIWKSEAEGALA